MEHPAISSDNGQAAEVPAEDDPWAPATDERFWPAGYLDRDDGQPGTRADVPGGMPSGPSRPSAAA